MDFIRMILESRSYPGSEDSCILNSFTKRIWKYSYPYIARLVVTILYIKVDLITREEIQQN